VLVEMLDALLDDFSAEAAGSCTMRSREATAITAQEA
jgi:hypothetical protein